MEICTFQLKVCFFINNQPVFSTTLTLACVWRRLCHVFTNCKLVGDPDMTCKASNGTIILQHQLIWHRGSDCGKCIGFLIEFVMFFFLVFLVQTYLVNYERAIKYKTSKVLERFFLNDSNIGSLKNYIIMFLYTRVHGEKNL